MMKDHPWRLSSLVACRKKLGGIFRHCPDPEKSARVSFDMTTAPHAAVTLLRDPANREKIFRQ
jgi:hypothetical protein